MTAQSKITADTSGWQSLPTWMEMWAACKGTDQQQACLEHIAATSEAEYEKGGDSDIREVHVAAYDAAYSSDSDDERDAFIEGMEKVFAIWQAQEEYHSAAYAHEARTGRSTDSSASLWDSGAWIKERASDILAAEAV